MPFNSEIHHRRSIRLAGYDYTRPGAYFVTICAQERQCLFGSIHAGKMILNEGGKMVEKWVRGLECKFQTIRCLDSVVMPNHVHCIIQKMAGADRAMAIEMRKAL